MKKLLLIPLIFFLIANSHAQEEVDFVSKSFLIIHSTKSYDKALKNAQLACNKLGLTLNLRNMYKDKENGLATSEKCGCGENHGYTPRGRWNDGNYISIEYSSRFSSFSPGYYMVIISSGEKEKVKTLLPKAKEYYKTAYIKDQTVYLGCMH